MGHLHQNKGGSTGKLPDQLPVLLNQLADAGVSQPPTTNLQQFDGVTETTQGVLPHVLRLPPVTAITGLGRSSIYALVKQGKLAKPIKLTGRAVGWLYSDVLKFINDRISESRQPKKGVK